MRALATAALTTKTSGLPSRSASSMVAPIDLRRRRIHDEIVQPLRAQVVDLVGEAPQGNADIQGSGDRPCIPPVGQVALRVDVHQTHRPLTGAFRRDGEMAGKGGLADAALAGGYCDDFHSVSTALGSERTAFVRNGLTKS
jgi:hypothetical protein